MTTETILATANGGAFHLAKTTLLVHKRRGHGVPMSTEDSRRYWLNEGAPLPRRRTRVWVIRMGIVNGCALGGCDVTHARSEKQARQAWAEFLVHHPEIAEDKEVA